jgi:lipoprotein-anchoring transpeptidase ErfK/SrfK
MIRLFCLFVLILVNQPMAIYAQQNQNPQTSANKESSESEKLSPKVTSSTQTAPTRVVSAEASKVSAAATVDLSKKTSETTNRVAQTIVTPPKPKKFVSHGENSEERLLEILEKKVSQALEKKDYQAAVDLYRKYGQKPSWSSKNKEKILNDLREVTYLSLFQEGASSDLTTAYKVKKGDSLFKIAKDQNTTIEMIQKLNSLKADVIYPDQELKVLKSPLKVLIDKSENKLYLFTGDQPFKKYVISTGKDGSTPEGDFKIVNKLKNPTWYKTGAIIPAESPDNHLGPRWLGFDKKGYGIHGTVHPEDLGKSVSAGCVRMKNEEVEELYSFLPQQSLVKVVA